MPKISITQAYLIIAVVSLFSFFFFNDIIPANIMEARNLATAQEMVRNNEYMVPTMNGELRLEKPPLPTWIAAVVEHITPENLAVQRCVTGFSALFMAIFLFLFVRMFTKDNMLGLLSALVLVTSYNIIMNGRTATWDIYCHTFMLGAMYNLFKACNYRGKRWINFIAAGILLGLSFLSKGPVSFYALLLPGLVCFIMIFRPKMTGKWIPTVIMVLIFAIIAFWWPVYIALSHADTSVAVAAKETGAWMNRNVRPLWYYWHFPDESGIWILFWVSSFCFFVKAQRPQYRSFFCFTIWWNILIFIALSIIPEKKTRYLLPILIPGAINIAFYFWYSIKAIANKGERRLMRFNGGVIAVLSLIIPIALYVLFVRSQVLSWPMFIVATALFLSIGIYIFKAIFNAWHKIYPLRIFAGAVAVMVVFLVFCFIPAGHLFLNEQRNSIRLLKSDPRVADMPYYHDEQTALRIELVYEANRNISPIDLLDSTLTEKMPFVLLSLQPAEELLTDRPVDIEYIGTFDNNWRKTDHKRYNPALVYRAAIIRPRPAATEYTLSPADSTEIK